MHGGKHWKAVIVLLIFFLGLTATPGTAAPAPQDGGEPLPSSAAAAAQQGSLVAMESPSACPEGGCAAGQRLNMRFEFEPSDYNGDLEPNVKMCVYAPSGWAVSAASVTADAAGELTGQPYTLPAEGDRGCLQDDAPPNGYDLILERVAKLPANTLIDTVGFGFRLGPAAVGNGRILARLFARSDETTWARVQQATSTPTITVTPAAERTFVANDAAACGTAIPCYINSGEDLENGVGTGLKDAIDAAPEGATLYVLGSYTIRSRTVLVNKKVLLSGPGDSRITYNQTGACENTMLKLTGEVTVSDLLINDGSCASPSRSLIEVDSPAPVVIERNDLLSGADAITMADNSGALLVRFNDIHGNSGYAVKATGSAQKGQLTVIANNLDRNRSGGAIDCALDAADPLDYRIANHNYWGGSSPSSTNSHCTIEASKRLGLAIVLEPSKPGVRARLVTVTDKKTYSTDFDRKIAYAHTGTGSNFNLFIVDHGYATAGGPPFSYARGIESPSPCSNYWDIFLPPGEETSGSLELYFKYDRTPACMATINSNQYCDQTTAENKIPLYWYDPRSSDAAWITTGSEIDDDTDGQKTTCDTTTNEVKVEIDTSGRPDLEQDLNYVPLMVGVPVIRSFQPRASSQAITVNWTTNNEPDVVGFYVLRGQPDGALSPISDLIPRTGTALVGRSYAFLDSGRVNGVDYSYRLQVLRSDGTSIYSSIVKIAANPATITPTPTRTRTFTPRPTNTRFPTFLPTRFPTRIPTRTSTRAATLRPSTPIPTALVLSTLRPTLDTRTPGAAQTMTVWALTPQIIFPTMDLTAAAELGEGTAVFPGGETPFPGGTAVAAVTTGTVLPTLSPTPSLTSTPTSPRIPGNISEGAGQAPVSSSPWLSLALGAAAGLAATGGIGAAFYFLRIRKV